MNLNSHQGGVLILGAGAAGVSAAIELRTLGYDGRLTVVNGEADTPYNRTAVNKGLLQGQVTLASIALPLPDDDATTVWHGTRATRLDPVGRAAHLDSGTAVHYDAVLVATGADPRTLATPQSTGLSDRVKVLRTAADAFALRAALDDIARRRSGQPARVGVVGGGLLGAETADALSSEGCAVTLVDPDPAPMRRLFGASVSGWVQERQQRELTTAFGTSLLEVCGLADALIMRLSDGTNVAVDVVLVATGVTPAVAALTAMSLTPDRGVLVDDRLRVIAADRVYAAGDVARIRREGATTRGEHWGSALAQGRHAARVIAHDLGLRSDPGPFDVPESFATRLHGKAVTVHGGPRPGLHEVVLAGETKSDAVTVAFVDEDGRLHGAVSIGSPRALNKIRPLAAARRPLSEARELLDQHVPAAG